MQIQRITRGTVALFLSPLGMRLQGHCMRTQNITYKSFTEEQLQMVVTIESCYAATGPFSGLMSQWTP